MPVFPVDYVTPHQSLRNDLYVRGPHPWVDIRAFGAVPDVSNAFGTIVASGSVTATANTTAIQAAIDFTPPGGTLFIPEGVYRVKGNLLRKQITSGRNNPIRIVGTGLGSIIMQTHATADTLTLSAEAANDQMSGWALEDFTVNVGEGATAGDAIVLERVHRGIAKNVKVIGAGQACWRLKYAISNTFVNCVGNSSAFDLQLGRTVPKYGWWIGLSDASVVSNNNVFAGCIAEAVTTSPGKAWYTEGASAGNVWVGGLAQTSTIGFSNDATTPESVVWGMWVEGNTTNLDLNAVEGIYYFTGEQESLNTNPSGIIQSWTGTSQANLSAGTNYLAPSGPADDSGTEGARNQLVGAPFRTRRLDIRLSVAPGAGTSRTFTLRKNGAGTSMAVTISNTNTTGSNTTAVSFAAGDVISLEHTQSGAIAAAVGQWSLQWFHLPPANA